MKILGVVFIILAVLLSLAVIARLTEFFTMFGALVAGGHDGAQTGYIVGNLTVWFIQFFLIFILWKFGMKWVRRK